MAAILLLAGDGPGQAGTLLDHVDAFRRWSRHEVFTWNPLVRGDSPRLDLDEFDAVVLHYSLLVTSDSAVPPRLRDKLRRYRGLKVQYIQDDYRRVDAIAAAMRDLGIRVLFCLVPEDQIEQVWSEARLPGVVRRTTLAGCVPDALVGRCTLPPRERPLDVGYRARDLPFWLGRAAREKVRVGREFLERTRALGLRCDIAWREEDRLYGEDWVRFLSGCRTVLGTESAVSIVDFDGGVEARCREYQAAHPGAGFEEVHRAVLAPFEGNVVLRVVSPRVFEAATLRTGLVLFPGRYSGVLEAGRHYIPLAEDLSNLDEVARAIRDDAFLAEMTERAQRDVVLSGRYSLRGMVREFDETIEGQLGKAPPRGKLAFALARLGTAEPMRALPGLAHPLLRARNALALAASALGPVLASRDLRGLVRRRLTAAASSSTPPWGRVGADLVRLGLVRRHRERAGAAFAVRSEIRPDGTLWLESVCLPGTPVDGPASRHEGRPSPSRLVWDHRAAGGLLEVRAPGGTRLRLPVGEGGVYEFEAAPWLSAAAPAEWAAAIAPLLPGGGRMHR